MSGPREWCKQLDRLRTDLHRLAENVQPPYASHPLCSWLSNVRDCTQALDFDQEVKTLHRALDTAQQIKKEVHAREARRRMCSTCTPIMRVHKRIGAETALRAKWTLPKSSQG